jgi:hypothetical protein
MQYLTHISPPRNLQHGFILKSAGFTADFRILMFCEVLTMMPEKEGLVA